ncbi:MAG: hypothetical protein BJ554DRAFT_6284 [Olpidium bornovanus]|uniref:Uncharacterized protein n=1 Tax=Olpidium bornovanus TaxID=278681 RepID=A0A8H7ZYT6_9FUNG|nr:MAG: hypothetical protein BJ554DRAFT_6284 [Olpidium bornovanus]
MYRSTPTPPVRSQGFPFALDAPVRPRDLSLDLEALRSISMLFARFSLLFGPPIEGGPST